MKVTGKAGPPVIATRLIAFVPSTKPTHSPSGEMNGPRGEPRKIAVGKQSTYEVSMINSGDVAAEQLIVYVSLPETAEVAGTVYEALAARKPRRRYSVGYMAGAAALGEALPQDMLDAVLARRG